MHLRVKHHKEQLSQGRGLGMLAYKHFLQKSSESAALDSSPQSFYLLL